MYKKKMCVEKNTQSYMLSYICHRYFGVWYIVLCVLCVFCVDIMFGCIFLRNSKRFKYEFETKIYHCNLIS
jgi:hypothetical protein